VRDQTGTLERAFKEGLKDLSDWSREEHERQLAAFLIPNRRGRFQASLNGSKARAKLRQRMAHFPDLDPRYRLAVPPLDSDHQRGWILSTLAALGAPRSCYLVSENPDWDGARVDLDDALAQVLGLGYGTLISCVPGRVAYFEGEEPGNRWVLHRPT
jgi:hypothetical protein